MPKTFLDRKSMRPWAVKNKNKNSPKRNNPHNLKNMSEKPSSRAISSTEFKNRLGHYLDEAMEGKSVTVSRRGKPVVTLEPSQRVLPLGVVGQMTNDQEKLVEVAKTLNPYDLGRLIGLARQMVEENLNPKKKAKR